MNASQYALTFLLMFPMLFTPEKEYAKISETGSLFYLPSTSPEEASSITIILPGGLDWRPGISGQVYLDCIRRRLNRHANFVLRHDILIDDFQAIIDNLSLAINYFRQRFPEKRIVVIGVSIGGFLVGQYLISQRDEADNYFICIAHLCPDDFSYGIEKDPLLRTWKRKTAKLLAKEGKHPSFAPYRNNIPQFCRLPSSVHRKVTFIMGGRDEITKSLPKSFRNCAVSIKIVEKGYHCSYDTLLAIPEIIDQELQNSYSKNGSVALTRGSSLS
jgi:hypothetical protein